MKTIAPLLLGALLLTSLGRTAASASEAERAVARDSLFAMNNLLAWCIVPYDSVHRTPVERVEMLKRLGFTQYAWDWRQHHLKDLPEEISAAQEHGVRIRAVWLWIDETTDKVGRLSEANRKVIDAVNASKRSVEFWIGIHPNVFAQLDEAARIEKGVALLAYLRDQAARSGSTIALYNHGDWFGEPENQLKLIAALGDSSVGIVYNFHHGHEHLAQFTTLLARMLPHLRAVNINGMNPNGPKILTIGEGTHEKEMLRALEKSGYKGPIGILGHTEGEDVEQVLHRNVEGLKNVVRSFELSGT